MKHAHTAVCATSALVLCLSAASAPAADMVLNEYNCVAKDMWLAGNDYHDDLTKQDAYFAQRMLALTGDPTQIGRIEGNGGNWIELVVVTDHLNIQGWQLRWAETGATDTDGTDIWYGNSAVEQGILTFSSTAGIWSDLRKGTILTISQVRDIDVDTTWDGGGDDRNFTDGVHSGEAGVVTIDLNTDASYHPTPWAPDSASADWWIHVSTKTEQDLHDADAGYDRLVSTITNVDGDGPGKFSVGELDWQMNICDAGGTLVYGPIGEAIQTFGDFPGGLGDDEAGRLEADPQTAGLNNDDYDDVTSTTFGQANEWGGSVQNLYALRVPEPASLALLAAGIPLAIRRRRRR